MAGAAWPVGLLRLLSWASGVSWAGGAYTAAVSASHFLGAQASGGCHVHKDCSWIAAVCTRRACGRPADLQMRHQGRDQIPVSAVRQRRGGQDVGRGGRASI
ncbi:hypothetical protein J3A72_002669 [Stenotrophomonas sp. PvP093]|nr:hypothetical protein [Stenotrophomonas sp. PvP093]